MKILLIRLSALGDVIQTLPVAGLLRQRFPHAELHWLVEEASAPLLENHPHLTKVWIFPRRALRRGDFRPLKALLRSLWPVTFDWIFDFQGNLRSAFVSLFLCSGRRKVGYQAPVAREGSYLFYSHTYSVPFHLHKTERCVRLLEEAFRCPLRPISPPQFPPLPSDSPLHQWLRELPSSFLAFHPGVSRKYSIKQWPREYYLQLLEEIQHNWPDLPLLLSWGPGEEELVTWFQHRFQGHLWIPPKAPTLLELVHLLSKAQGFIAADTGPLHLASSLKIPVIGLYGPKPVPIYRPYFGGMALAPEGLACCPCNRKSCPYLEDYAPCMKAISPQEVLSHLRRLLT